MAKVNLLPSWLKRQRVVDWRTIVAVVVLVSAMASAGFYYYLSYQQVLLLQAEVAGVTEEQMLLQSILNRRQELVREKQAIEDKRDFLEAIRTRRWAPVLSELAAITPFHVELELLEFSDPDNLIIIGHSPHLEAIAQLMVGIDCSTWLERSDVRYARDDEGLYEFEVRCRIRREVEPS